MAALSIYPVQRQISHLYALPQKCLFVISQILGDTWSDPTKVSRRVGERTWERGCIAGGMKSLTNSHYTFRTQSPRTSLLDYGKEPTPTVTAIVSLFYQMANALVQKRQKKIIFHEPISRIQIIKLKPNVP